MGAQLSVVTPQASTIGIDAYLSELQDVQYEKNIGNARFLKTVKAVHADGLIVIKVFVKPNPGMNLIKISKTLRGIKKSIASVGNAVAYSRIVETERAGYIVRQYFRSNLYDRISTRPFLENIEKIWITYQLLRGLEDCHSRGVYHGDIKSENVLVTSWNWVFLSDFAPYKPVYIPEDDPSHYSFYFDTSQRRCCYVAPERFLGSGEVKEGDLTYAMDIFSLGCVIAELFLEGAPTLTLAQMFKFKKGEYSPPWSDIEVEPIRDLVQSMMDVDPEKRLSASEYLKQNRGNLFPEYFDFLHQYILGITTPSQMKKLEINDLAKQKESDRRINQIWKDYEKISSSLGYSYPVEKETSAQSFKSMVPVCLDLPGMNHWIPKLRKLTAMDDDGALVIVAVVCTAIRNTSRASDRIKGCELLLAFGERIHDEAKLDRCLPYLVALLEDPFENVQVAALRSLTHLLELVGAITPVNGNIFPEYIIPRLAPLLSHESEMVRAAYASCVASLAQSAARFLDMGQVLKTTGMLEEQDPETENGVMSTSTAFDSLKQTLTAMIEQHIIALLTDPSASVRRALLKQISSLCIFFGKQNTKDVILSHLITYLNDKNPLLRTEFFECVVGLGPFVGVISLEQYIIPLMIQTLADPVEFVVEKVLQALKALSDLGVMRAPRVWELLKTCAKFTIHPNAWIRNSTVAFFASTTRWMTPAQLYCMYLPILRPFLECEVNDFSEGNILRNLVPPMSRAVYNGTLTWASKAQKSIFWRVEKQTTSNKAISSRHVKLSRSAEDEQWLVRLKEIGLKSGDMWMLNVYKEYIYRVARVNHQLQLNGDDVNGSDGNPAQVRIQTIGVLPKNVFFDSQPRKPSQQRQPQSTTTTSAPKIRATKPMSIPNASATTSSEASRRANGILHGKASVDSSAGFGESTSPQIHQPIHDGAAEATRLLAVQQNSAANTPSSLGSSPGIMGQPSTATTTEEVYGEVAGGVHSKPAAPATPDNVVDLPELQEQQENAMFAEVKKSSSYSGDDPHIWKLLEAMYKESMSSDDPPQLGPRCRPYTRSSATSKETASVPKRRRGKPLGVLVSSFEEHSGPVNSVIVSPDHCFFVTGSDDMTIKVWDCFRLEKNVINRSVQTMNLESPVKHLTFIDKTYAFACATADGKVRLIRVDATMRTESLGPRYKKLVILGEFALKDNEHALRLEYVKGENSVVYLTTTKCRILTLAIRSMTIVEEMQNPVSHGLITSFVVDKQKNWIAVGTSRGIVDLWDLRFAILVKSWALPGGTPILRMTNHPSNDKWICISGGTNIAEITMWDVESSTCHEVYRGIQHAQNEEDYRGYTAQPVDKAVDDISLNGLARILNTAKRVDDQPNNDIYAMFSGIEFEQGLPVGRKGYMITGGADHVLRFWDLHNGELSSAISGFKSDAGRTVYQTVYANQNASKIVIEKMTAAVTKNGKPVARPERQPRSTVISIDQLDLGRNHAAAILDVALLLRPYEMVISVDRAGVVKVYL